MDDSGNLANASRLLVALSLTAHELTRPIDLAEPVFHGSDEGRRSGIAGHYCAGDGVQRHLGRWHEYTRPGLSHFCPSKKLHDDDR